MQTNETGDGSGDLTAVQTLESEIQALTHPLTTPIASAVLESRANELRDLREALHEAKRRLETCSAEGIKMSELPVQQTPAYPGTEHVPSTGQPLVGLETPEPPSSALSANDEIVEEMSAGELDEVMTFADTPQPGEDATVVVMASDVLAQLAHDPIEEAATIPPAEPIEPSISFADLEAEAEARSEPVVDAADLLTQPFETDAETGRHAPRPTMPESPHAIACASTPIDVEMSSPQRVRPIQSVDLSHPPAPVPMQAQPKPVPVPNKIQLAPVAPKPAPVVAQAPVAPKPVPVVAQAPVAPKPAPVMVQIPAAPEPAPAPVVAEPAAEPMPGQGRPTLHARPSLTVKRKEKSEERRIQPRTSLDVEVSLSSENNFYSGFTRDLSEGGLFIATFDMREIGDTLQVAFSLPNGRKISATAIVRWTRLVSGDGVTEEQWPGMGLQFTDLAEDARNAILSFMDVREPIFFLD